MPLSIGPVLLTIESRLIAAKLLIGIIIAQIAVINLVIFIASEIKVHILSTKLAIKN